METIKSIETPVTSLSTRIPEEINNNSETTSILVFAVTNEVVSANQETKKSHLFYPLLPLPP
jgi:hypothetical protein